MKSRLPVGRLAVEFFAILIGVLLALAVDQWAGRRGHRELADAVLQALGAELTANLGQLDRRIAYHEEIRPTLDSLMAREDAVSNGLLRPEVLGAPDHGGAAIFLAATFEDVLAGERELRSFVDAAIDAIRVRLGEDVSLESPIQVSVSGSLRWPTAALHRPATSTLRHPMATALLRNASPAALRHPGV